MNRPLTATIVLLAMIYCAVLIASSEHAFGLSLKKELDPVSLASLELAIFIAFYIQFFYVRRSGDLRAEKDLLIENQMEVIKLAKGSRAVIDKTFAAGKITKNMRDELLLSMRDLANALDIFGESLAQSECSNKFANDFLRTKDLYYKFKSAATGGSFPSRPYSSLTISEIDRSYRLLLKDFQGWFFKINRFH